MRATREIAGGPQYVAQITVLECQKGAISETFHCYRRGQWLERQLTGGEKTIDFFLKMAVV